MPRSRPFLGPVYEQYLRTLPPAGHEHPTPRPASPRRRILARGDQDGQGNRACVTRVAAPGTGGLWCSRHAGRPDLLLSRIHIRPLYLPETARAADRLPAECPASRCDGQRILQIGRAFLRGGVSTRQRNRPSPRPTPRNSRSVPGKRSLCAKGEPFQPRCGGFCVRRRRLWRWDPSILALRQLDLQRHAHAPELLFEPLEQARNPREVARSADVP